MITCAISHVKLCHTQADSGSRNEGHSACTHSYTATHCSPQILVLISLTGSVKANNITAVINVTMASCSILLFNCC